MDIKLIRNTEDAVFKPINNGLVLQMVDDNYKFLDFIGKKLYILNSITNERYEISPEIKKYNIASIIMPIIRTIMCSMYLRNRLQTARQIYCCTDIHLMITRVHLCIDMRLMNLRKSDKVIYIYMYWNMICNN